MPSQYSDAQKQEAMEMLKIGDEIAFVHYSTGIPKRTLRSWRKQLTDQSDCQMAEKTISTAAIWQSEANTPTEADPMPAHSDSDENDNSTNTDVADFSFIRDQLMKYVRQLAADLRPDDPDSNRRTLPLTRILDRIQWLDQILPDRIPEQVIRFEHYYNGSVHEHPPWYGASKTEEGKYYRSRGWLRRAHGIKPEPPPWEKRATHTASDDIDDQDFP